QNGKDKRQWIAVRQVPHERTDQDRDDKTDDHAKETTEQVGQRSAGQPEIDRSPPAQQVRRSEVREDQAFQCAQRDDGLARVRSGTEAPNHEITERETTDHSEPRPSPSGEILGTLHGLPPQETEIPASSMNAPDFMGEENTAETASATERTSTTLRPDGRPALAPNGINARVRP